MGYETDNPLHGRTPQSLGASSELRADRAAARPRPLPPACSAGRHRQRRRWIDPRAGALLAASAASSRRRAAVPSTGHQPACLGPFSLIGVVGTDGPHDRRSATARSGGSPAGTPTDPMAVPLGRVKAEGRRHRRKRMFAIAFFEDDGVVPVTADTRAAVRRAARAAADAGFTVEEYCPPALADAARVWDVFFAEVGLAGAARRAGRRRAGPADSAGLPRTEHRHLCHRRLLRAICVASPLSAARSSRPGSRATVCAPSSRPQLGPHARAASAPVAPPCPAFGHGERAWDVEGRRVGYLESMRYTQWFNVLGAPAVVVPVARSRRRSADWRAGGGPSVRRSSSCCEVASAHRA